MGDQPRVLADVGALKALAHPLRQRLLARLQQQGPATSADIAGEFAIDRGAASYHLRQLHRYGFVDEDSARTAGRRRYWRAVPSDLRLPPPGSDPELTAAADEVMQYWYRAGQQALAGFQARREAFGAFADAAAGSHGGLFLTAGELAGFAADYLALLARWQQGRDAGTAPPGAQHCTALFYAFPTPDPVGGAPVTVDGQ